MIIQGQQQTLVLDPRTFSIDPDQNYFNSSVGIRLSDIVKNKVCNFRIGIIHISVEFTIRMNQCYPLVIIHHVLTIR